MLLVLFSVHNIKTQLNSTIVLMQNYIVVLFLLYFCNDCKEVSGHSTRSPDRKDENECDGDRECYY